MLDPNSGEEKPKLWHHNIICLEWLAFGRWPQLLVQLLAAKEDERKGRPWELLACWYHRSMRGAAERRRGRYPGMHEVVFKRRCWVLWVVTGEKENTRTNGNILRWLLSTVAGCQFNLFLPSSACQLRSGKISAKATRIRQARRHPVPPRKPFCYVW